MSQPNIVLIMSDQHRSGIMKCAGDAVADTPNLDRLAHNGVRFSTTYCPSPLCGPSRMSFMTTRYPYETEIWINEQQLPSDTPTFVHALTSAGYETVVAGRTHFVGSDQLHGFQKRIISDVPGTVHLSAGWMLDDILGEFVDTPGAGYASLVKSGPGHTGYQAFDVEVTNAAVRWINSRCDRKSNAQDKPFFLSIGYVSPHNPFIAPVEDYEYFARKLSAKDLPRVGESQHPYIRALRDASDIRDLPPSDVRLRVHASYYGLCRFVDRQIGKILSALESNELHRNTVIIYTSDHGEMLGRHGLWWKSNFFEEAVTVPLIIAGLENADRSRIVNQPVGLIDVGPTVLEIAGANPLPRTSGASLLDLAKGSTRVDTDYVFSEYAAVPLGKRPGVIARMVRSGPWKYNYYHGLRSELFNLQKDPFELEDLSVDVDFREICEQLHAAVLRDWDPSAVVLAVERIDKELSLVAHWVSIVKPPEPDPMWFEAAPENFLDK